MPVDEAILGVSQSRGSPQTIAAVSISLLIQFKCFIIHKISLHLKESQQGDDDEIKLGEKFIATWK